MHVSNPIRAVWLCSLICTGSTVFTAGAQSAADCDSACLKGFVDGYFDALAHRDASKLPVVTDVKFTENGRVQDLGMGFWKSAGAPTRYRDYVLDPQSGGAAALTAFNEHDGVTQMFLRLKIANRRITEIETIVVRVGDQRWFAPENLERLSDLFAQTVPVAQRHTREQLVAAANAYFTAVHTEGTPEFVQAPFAPGMKRIENGLQTTNVTANPILERHKLGPDVQLENAFYKGTQVMDRRFPVVDVEHGLVLGSVAFRREGADTSTLLLAEVFKVTDGKLREIRAVMTGLPHGAGTGWTAAH